MISTSALNKFSSDNRQIKPSVFRLRANPITSVPLLALAPMAGVTDRPFRTLCRRMGADLATSEMVSANPRLWHTEKTRRRLDHRGEPDPVSVQIAGFDPAMLAEAARFNVDHGAGIIDINMGCPAKKVCNVAAGSALLRDEVLVGQILDAVVKAVPVPVTLKIRTGWSPTQRNGVRIARIAEQSGVQALAVHGRTRTCFFKGQAEYQTIREIKAAVSIPILANGDIDSEQSALSVLQITAADGLMIGRAAQGRPWIFRAIRHFLETGQHLAPPSPLQIRDILLEHLETLYSFYGEYTGVRIARKHLSWYSKSHAGADQFRKSVNRIEDAKRQLIMTQNYFNHISEERQAA